MPTKSEAISAFLKSHTHSDLAALYNLGMEVQVNVAQDSGDPIEGESGYTGRMWRGYSDGVQTWKPFRIPWNAKVSPEYSETTIKNGVERPKQLTWDLAQHAEGIGMTGWCWTERVSKWVAFDFDNIAAHPSSGISAAELQQIQEATCKIPWITIRKSTSGQGLHLYVFLDNVPTANHTEHAALARAILGKMTATTGFAFDSKVDICGGNMWVWHRKMAGTDGLTPIKVGRTLIDIPVNWKDHLPVIQGKRRKNLPHYVEGQDLDQFEQLTGQRPRVKLDEGHKKLLSYLDEIKAQWWYDNDNHLLVCHTFDLKRAHDELKLRGIFETLATGHSGAAQGADHNCFCAPLEHPEGAWVVRRFHPGEQEHQTWSQDASGWTKCYFNREPTLDTAARAFKGIEGERGEFFFNDAKTASTALQTVGTTLKLPSWAENRDTIIKPHKDGKRLIVKIKRESTDRYDDIDGWREDKGFWTKIFDARLAQSESSEPQNYDGFTRHIVSCERKDAGWSIRSENQWHDEPLTHIKLALKSIGLSDPDVNKTLGNCILNSWILVNKPFQPEYPGNREWNRNAAQLRYTPQQEEPFKHPTWDRVLNHAGSGFDIAIKHDGWCQANGISNGGDYLRLWVASLIQEPSVRLPYIFLYSPEQKTGKSTLHEALQLLVTREGYMKVNQALLSEGGFNGEMVSAVLCALDECDLRKSKQAKNKMKDWVTSRDITIHAKHGTPYLIQNVTHFIHTGNDPAECDITTGDTRVSFSRVPLLKVEELIPRDTLFSLLEREASAFIATLLKVELPPLVDRLGVPVIETLEKRISAQSNQDEFHTWLDECTFRVPGESIRYSDFYAKFVNWLDPSDAMNWSKIRVGKNLPIDCPKGRLSADGSQYHIANISFTEPVPQQLAQPRYVLRGEVLVLEDKP